MPPLIDDGDRDRFFGHDMAIRRASATEDVPWVFGARGQLGYDEDTQGVQEQDIVFWYVAHHPHMAALGPDQMAGHLPYPAHSTVALCCMRPDRV